MGNRYTKVLENALYFTTLLVLLVACGSAPQPASVATIRPPDPTSTLEPTFTPASPPTYTSSPLPAPTTAEPIPTATPAEPTPLASYEVSLLGRILDQTTGQPVAGARVSLDAFATTTDADGRYTLTGLPPGQHVLSVIREGYDPALSPILPLNPDQLATVDLELYTTDTTPYPQDPMLTNPLDPNGAPTVEDAGRLARLQGLTGEVVKAEEIQLTGEYLVNYKREGEVRAAVADLNHDAWALTDDAGRTWWIIKVCGNLASPLPQEAPIPTPEPRPLLPQAEVVVDGLSLRDCASEECAEVGMVPQGAYVDVLGCLADGGWCEVAWPGGSGWCTGGSLQKLAVVGTVPVVKAVLPTATPEAVAGKIVFASTRDGQDRYDIYVMNADGSGIMRLTDHPLHDLDPTWSPDGQELAFESGRDDTVELYVMNADGSNQTRLLQQEPEWVIWNMSPSWAPNGRQIAFESVRDGNYDIYVVNIDDGALTRLTDHPDNDGSPSWSPDGLQIAFSSDRDSPRRPEDINYPYALSEIYVMNADGSEQKRLTYDTGGGPAWSPDGQHIAFVSRQDQNFEIFVMKADGNDPTRLTNHPANDGSPTWSPDGRQIAFTSDRDGKRQIYVMNADGTGLTQLTFEGDNCCPAWSR